MSIKSDVLAALNAVVAQVSALPDADPSIADLQGKLDAAVAALAADDASVASDVAQVSALQAKIDAAKLALS